MTTLSDDLRSRIDTWFGAVREHHSTPAGRPAGEVLPQTGLPPGPLLPLIDLLAAVLTEIGSWQETGRHFHAAAEGHTEPRQIGQCEGHAEGLIHAAGLLEEAIAETFNLMPPMTAEETADLGDPPDLDMDGLQQHVADNLSTRWPAWRINKVGDRWVARRADGRDTLSAATTTQLQQLLDRFGRENAEGLS